MFVDKVVLIPGICGSELMDGDDLLWPGMPWNKIFQSYPDRFVEKLVRRQTVQATGILRSVPLNVGGVTLHHFDGYGQAFEALEQAGFSERDGTLIPFAYDWRKDVRSTAAVLRDFLVAQHLVGVRVGIVAHSMGGLVTRYLLEYIGLPAGVTVSIAVLVAVPHLGSPASLQNGGAEPGIGQHGDRQAAQEAPGSEPADGAAGCGGAQPGQGNVERSHNVSSHRQRRRGSYPTATCPTLVDKML